MTIHPPPGWTPEIEEGIPRYLAIADAIARDLAVGRLRAGDRLPTHRELARALGVTVGTVSRGYAESERRGLTHGEVGRGTFLRSATAADAWPAPEPAEPTAVDLCLSLPVRLPEEAELLAETLREIAADPRAAGRLLAYRPETAAPHQLGVAAEWLGRLGLSTSADRLLVTAGSQHALNVVMASVFQPGQVLLTEELTYPPVKSQARAFGIRLRGIAMDEEGILPEAVDEACRTDPRPAGLYLVPTLQNPTSATLSPERRDALAELAQEHGLWIVEDDVHAFLPGTPHLPIAARAPERTLYLSSVSKCLEPGLRTGFVAAPEALHARLVAGIHTSVWMAAPLMVEVTTRWIAGGIAERLITAKRRETEARQRLARRLLRGLRLRADPAGYQLWLELPEAWTSDEAVGKARERGVIVNGAGAFAIGRRDLPHAIRLSLGGPTPAQLESALSTLAELLSAGAAPAY